MTFRVLWRVAVTLTLASAVLTAGAGAPLAQPASAATSEGIAALAVANLGKGAGTCSTVNSSDNSLGGRQFDGSCTGTKGGPQYWCSDFAKWVWQNADNGAVNVHGLDASAASFYSYGVRNGTLHTSSSYRPQVGDAIVYGYGWDGPGTAAHVALVTSVSADGTITTENGDWNGVTGYGMVKFAETSKVETTTIQPGEAAVGSTPSWTSYPISAYVTPVTTASTRPTCTAAALASVLTAADAQLHLQVLLPENWTVRDYACQSGFALAGLGGIGYPDDAIYRQQGPSWMFVCVLGEFNVCSTEQNGSIVRVSKSLEPSPALLQSLLDQASRARA